MRIKLFYYNKGILFLKVIIKTFVSLPKVVLINIQKLQKTLIKYNKTSNESLKTNKL